MCSIAKVTNMKDTLRNHRWFSMDRENTEQQWNEQKWQSEIHSGLEELAGIYSPVLTTTEAGAPSAPATWVLTRTIYSVSGSSSSISATVASPETN